MWHILGLFHTPFYPMCHLVTLARLLQWNLAKNGRKMTRVAFWLTPSPCVIWWHCREPPPSPLECHVLFEWPQRGLLHVGRDTKGHNWVWLQTPDNLIFTIKPFNAKRWQVVTKEWSFWYLLANKSINLWQKFTQK